MTNKPDTLPEGRLGAGRLEALAAKLTEAQREALSDPFGTMAIDTFTSAACRCALQRKGLVVDRMYAVSLTPLGLALRAHLLNQEKPK